MAAECGLFGIGLIQGRVCAGALSCRIGDTYVMLLSASDPKMSTYRLGMLTCLWSIGDCIERGARECHLLWGRYAYKHQLQAMPQVLQRMTVYPSVRHMLLQPATVLMMLLRHQYVRIEQWLREQVAAQRIPGLRWLLRRYRLMKPRLVVLEKILQGLRCKRTSLMSDKKTRHTAAGNVAGTAD
jgi:CelD/BcsL family acetyltransferase involved in cellulose biosynthesis